MNRAGRKKLMYQALLRHDTQHPKGCLVTAKVAHAAGLKSSTAVVNMLREMEAEGLIVERTIQPFYECGYFVRAWQIAHYEQVPLPREFIIINGVKCNYAGEVIADVQI